MTSLAHPRPHAHRAQHVEPGHQVPACDARRARARRRRVGGAVGADAARAADGRRAQGPHRAPAQVRFDRRRRRRRWPRSPAASRRWCGSSNASPGQKDARWIHLLGDVPTSRAGSALGWFAARRRARRPSRSTRTARRRPSSTTCWPPTCGTPFGLQLLDLLADVDPADGPIDRPRVGNRDRPAVPRRAAVPGAEVFAIEPSKAMRVALHARLTDYPDLRTVTTVSPSRLGRRQAAEAGVGGRRLGGVRPPLRRRARPAVAVRRRADAGRRPGRDRRAAARSPGRLRSAASRTASSPVGDYVYEGWQSGVPIDDRSMSWTLDVPGASTTPTARRSPSTQPRRRGDAIRRRHPGRDRPVRADADRARGLRRRAPAVERLTDAGTGAARRRAAR